MDFCTSMIAQQIFRFSISSKQVGFLVLGLNQVASNPFKLMFFLCNDLGIGKAKSFSKSGLDSLYSWQVVRSKNNSTSFADAVKSNFEAPLRRQYYSTLLGLEPHPSFLLVLSPLFH